jgi:hypothetical protein
MKLKSNKIIFTLVFLMYSIVPLKAEDFFDDVEDVPIDDNLPILFVFAILLGFFFVREQLKVRK